MYTINDQILGTSSLTLDIKYSEILLSRDIND